MVKFAQVVTPTHSVWQMLSRTTALPPTSTLGDARAEVEAAGDDDPAGFRCPDYLDARASKRILVVGGEVVQLQGSPVYTEDHPGQPAGRACIGKLDPLRTEEVEAKTCTIKDSFLTPRLRRGCRCRWSRCRASSHRRGCSPSCGWILRKKRRPPGAKVCPRGKTSKSTHPGLGQGTWQNMVHDQLGAPPMANSLMFGPVTPQSADTRPMQLVCHHFDERAADLHAVQIRHILHDGAVAVDVQHGPILVLPEMQRHFGGAGNAHVKDRIEESGILSKMPGPFARDPQ